MFEEHIILRGRILKKLNQRLKEITMIHMMKTHAKMRSLTDIYEKTTEAYIRYIVRLHGVPVIIVSGMDPRFLAHFWQKFQEAFGITLNLESRSNRPLMVKQNALTCYRHVPWSSKSFERIPNHNQNGPT